MSDWDTYKYGLAYEVRYGDGTGWTHAATGLSILGGHIPSDADTTLVVDVFSGLGDSIRTAATTYVIPVELLVAIICTDAGDYVGADCVDFRRELDGYISDEETPSKVCLGCTGLTLELGGTEDDVDAALTATANHIINSLPETRFQSPLVAAAYNLGQVMYDQNSTWRMANYDGLPTRVDRFISHLNAAIREVQADNALAGDAPSYGVTLPLVIPSPTAAPETPPSGGFNKDESQQAVVAGLLVICASNADLTAVWSLADAAVDELGAVAVAYGAGLGLPMGESTYGYADKAGANHELTGDEVQRLWRVLRDQLALIRLYDTDQADSLPGQPAFMG